MDVKSDERRSLNGAGAQHSEQLSSLVDPLDRIADALERQALLLADLLNQNTAILESLLDDDEQQEDPDTDMEGNPIRERR